MEGDYYDNKGMIVVNAFQSTPSAWRETSSNTQSAYDNKDFNPLPPHGGRHLEPLRPILHIIISIHSLRMEGDTKKVWTPSDVHNISIHSLRMEGDFQIGGKSDRGIFISIHSLRMEGDPEQTRYSGKIPQFQSTPSAWRETLRNRDLPRPGIHFNPLPPHGGRPPRLPC